MLQKSWRLCDFCQPSSVLSDICTGNVVVERCVFIDSKSLKDGQCLYLVFRPQTVD